MMQSFRKMNISELLEVDCVDLYRLSDTQNSLAFRFVMQGVEETLSEVQISEIVARFKAEAEKKFKAELR
jgi:phenylalanyl-tRNA synthetase beta subunit